MRGRGEGCFDIADLLDHVGRDVAGDVVVHEQVGGASGLDADDRGQRLVVDADPRAGVLGQVSVTRDDHDDGLTHVVDLVPGQGVLGAAMGQRGVGDEQGEGFADAAGQVLVGVDRDEALDVQGPGDVDVDDLGVGVRAAHEGGREGSPAEVVEELAAAGDQSGVLAATDGGAEHLGRHEPAPSLAARASTPALLRFSALICAARRTDFTMFW